MRFMGFVKSAEQAGPPPEALQQAMGQMIEEWTKKGALVDTGGLAPTAMGTYIRVSGGSVTVHDGPFSEAKEVVGGYAVMQFDSKEAAVEATKQFMELHHKHWPGWEGECELRQIFGPND